MSQTFAEIMQNRLSKENRWYYKSIDNHVPLPSRKLLEDYSHIPADEVDSHIYEMVSIRFLEIMAIYTLLLAIIPWAKSPNSSQRDILWAYGPYPCIGEFKFLTLNLASHPQYTRIVDTLSRKSSPPSLLLDLGCCVAQELRDLANRGVNSSNLYGTDLNHRFLETSYELFKDKGAFHGQLVAADIFSPLLFQKEFLGWENKFSIVHAGLFLHLFDWEKQVKVCCSIVKMLSGEIGDLFVGEMVGCRGGGERSHGKGQFWKEGEERKQYLHDKESFEKIWNEVGERTETVGKWKVDGLLRVRERVNEDPTNGCAFFTGEGIGWFTFSVERITE